MIVVLVILAILAAMMVPALLGWIDEARNKQYVLEARSVYMAAQAVADEEYSKQTHNLTNKIFNEAYKRIAELSDVTLEDDWLEICNVEKDEADSHEAFKITAMYFHFKSGGDDGTEVYATLQNDSWDVVFVEPDPKPATLNGGVAIQKGTT